MIRKLGIFVLAPVTVLFTMALPQDAFAQEPTSEERSEVRKRGKGGAEKGAQGKSGSTPEATKRITLDEAFQIEDQREKPQAFYVFRRSKMDYDWARLEVRFTPLVLESVQDPLF